MMQPRPRASRSTSGHQLIATQEIEPTTHWWCSLRHHVVDEELARAYNGGHAGLSSPWRELGENQVKDSGPLYDGRDWPSNKDF